MEAGGRAQFQVIDDNLDFKYVIEISIPLILIFFAFFQLENGQLCQGPGSARLQVRIQ
jgi:hypothetical protein